MHNIPTILLENQGDKRNSLTNSVCKGHKCMHFDVFLAQKVFFVKYKCTCIFITMRHKKHQIWCYRHYCVKTIYLVWTHQITSKCLLISWKKILKRESKLIYVLVPHTEFIDIQIFDMFCKISLHGNILIANQLFNSRLKCKEERLMNQIDFGKHLTTSQGSSWIILFRGLASKKMEEMVIYWFVGSILINSLQLIIHEEVQELKGSLTMDRLSPLFLLLWAMP